MLLGTPGVHGAGAGARRKKTWITAADLWSMAVVMYEMVGRHPMYAASNYHADAARGGRGAVRPLAAAPRP